MYSDRQISFVSYSVQCVWLSVLFIKEKWINTIRELGQPYQETTEMLCHLQITDTVYGTDEQYVLYCIEIPYQKLGLYWYWLILHCIQFSNTLMPQHALVQLKPFCHGPQMNNTYCIVLKYHTKSWHCIGICLFFQNSAIPILNQYQPKFQFQFC